MFQNRKGCSKTGKGHSKTGKDVLKTGNHTAVEWGMLVTETL